MAKAIMISAAPPIAAWVIRVLGWALDFVVTYTMVQSSGHNKTPTRNKTSGRTMMKIDASNKQLNDAIAFVEEELRGG